MADTTADRYPSNRLERLETAIAQLRYAVIAVLVVMIASFAVLGFQLRRLDGRIDQLTAKVDGIDTTLGVKFDETNAKLDATSQRLAVELKTMQAEITAQTNALAKSIAASGNIAPAPSAPVPPTPSSAQPKPSPGQPQRSRP
jgi:hypothetical protein